MSAFNLFTRPRRSAAGRGRRGPAALAALLLLVGCSGSAEPSPSAATARNPSASTANALHLVATLKLGEVANAMVATPDALWVLGGSSGVVTKVDPATNTVVKEITAPHPPGFGTFADGPRGSSTTAT